MTIQEQVDQMVPVLRRKAEGMCAGAIGKRWGIRIDKRTVQYGNICRCEVKSVGYHAGPRGGQQVRALFQVWLENNGLHFGPYTVKRLP